MVLFLILTLIIPVAYIVVGLIFWKGAHKKINGTAGWRTKRAMINQETWTFANSYGGKSVFVLGIILAAVSVGLGILLSTLNYEGTGWVIVIAVVQIGLLGIVYYRVENAIVKNFNGNGQRIT